MAAPSFAHSRAARLRPRLLRDPAAPARIRILLSAAPRIRPPPSLPCRSARPPASLCSIRATLCSIRAADGALTSDPGDPHGPAGSFEPDQPNESSSLRPRWHKPPPGATPVTSAGIG